MPAGRFFNKREKKLIRRTFRRIFRYCAGIRNRIADFQAEQTLPGGALKGNGAYRLFKLHAGFHGIVKGIGIECADIGFVEGQAGRDIHRHFHGDAASVHGGAFYG